MKKGIIATLVFVPSLFLSGCYLTSTSDNYNYVGYSPTWQNASYSNNGWGGAYQRGWYGNRGWGRGGWSQGSWGHHGGWGYAGRHGA